MKISFYNKKILFLLFILISTSFCSRGEVSLNIQPIPVKAGEKAKLVINSTEGKAKIKKLPEVEGLKWLERNKNATRITIINGVRYEKTVYPFLIDEPEKLKLPSMIITVNGKKYRTEQRQVKVTEGPLSNLDELLLIKSKYIIEDKEKVYVGQEIPLKINFFVAEEISAMPVKYPQLNFNKTVIFDDFSKLNKQNDRFAKYPFSRGKNVNLNGINYTKTTFFTSFRPIEAGKLKGSASLRTSVHIPRRRNNNYRRNTSFNNFLNRNTSLMGGMNKTSRILETSLPEVKVKSLPSVPQNNFFLGLVGKWEIDAELKSENFKEGEPFTLSLNVSGKGSLENLSPPDISLNGFNVYSPTVKKSEGLKLAGSSAEAKINYILVPTKSGKKNLVVKFSTFNIETEEYDTKSIKKTLTIESSGTSFEEKQQSPVSDSSKETKPSPTHKTEKKNQKGNSNSILYLKRDIGEDVLLPLWNNNKFFILLFLLLGPILWGIFEILKVKKINLFNNTNLSRRDKAIKRKLKVIRSLKNSQTEEELVQKVKDDVIPYINDLKNLPAGTTAEELKYLLEDKESEISKILQEVTSSSYKPESKKNASELKGKILKELKKLSVFIFFFIPICLAFNVNANEYKDINKLTKNYNNANFDKCIDICQSHLNTSSLNPDWLYNLGNAYYKKNNFAMALLCYERAHYLAPRDYEIINNLNLLRKKFNLSKVNQINPPTSFLYYIRNKFRPDEWLLIFSIACTILFFALILKRFNYKRICIFIFLLSALFMIGSSLAIISQYSTTYNKNRGMILKDIPKVYTTPSDDSPVIRKKLSIGEKVFIKENIKQKWVKISKNHDIEGWVKIKKVKPILPGSLDF